MCKRSILDDYIDVLDQSNGKGYSVTIRYLMDMIRTSTHMNNEISYPITPLSIHQWNYDMMSIQHAWKRGYSGKGVTVMVVDTPVDSRHPDLHNVDMSISGTVNGDPIPIDRPMISHGTAIASIIGGTGNKYIVGIAYRCRLGSVLYNYPYDDRINPSTLTYNMDKVDIYNLSLQYGVDCPSVVPTSISIEYEEQVLRGTTYGRKGNGCIYVMASGNQGDIGVQTGMFGLLNIHEVIVVGAVSRSGNNLSYETYGPAMLVCAPSAEVTSPERLLAAIDIDNNRLPWGYNMGSTSGAVPHISGLIALLLEARRSLTWRDIQHILVFSSLQVYSPVDIGREGIGSISFLLNTSGLYYSRYYGYGIPNASIAIDIATTWKLLPDRHTYDYTIQLSNPTAIPYGNTPLSIEIDTSSADGIAIETVLISFDIRGSAVNDIWISIVSPSGSGPSTIISAISISDSCPQIVYTLSSYMKIEAFRDEHAHISGKKWILYLSNTVDTSINTIHAVSMRIYGYMRSGYDYPSTTRAIRDRHLL